MTQSIRNRMDPKWKKRWVKALRSGKYMQTTGALQNANGFCCLGVLCDVVAKHKDGGGMWRKIDDYNHFEFQHDDCVSELPASVAELVKLDDTDPTVASGGKKRCLSRWNDGSKLSFERIANIIEREL